LVVQLAEDALIQATLDSSRRENDAARLEAHKEYYTNDTLRRQRKILDKVKPYTEGR
jgi:hypothetical protein